MSGRIDCGRRCGFELRASDRMQVEMIRRRMICLAPRTLGHDARGILRREAVRSGGQQLGNGRLHRETSRGFNRLLERERARSQGLRHVEQDDQAQGPAHGPVVTSGPGSESSPPVGIHLDLVQGVDDVQELALELSLSVISAVHISERPD